MPILRILLCMHMLLFVTCSATDSYSFKNKLRGLAAVEIIPPAPPAPDPDPEPEEEPAPEPEPEPEPPQKYIFNANVDLTIDGVIFYHFDSIQSDNIAFYKTADGSSFYALGIKEDIREVHRSAPASSSAAVNVGALTRFLKLLDPQ